MTLKQLLGTELTTDEHSAAWGGRGCWTYEAPVSIQHRRGFGPSATMLLMRESSDDTSATNISDQHAELAFND